MERALFELEKRWRGGVEWPQTSKTTWFIKTIYITLLDGVIAYPKRGGKSRRRRRRPQREGNSASVGHIDAGSSTSSSLSSGSGSNAAVHPSSPSNAPGPSTGSADVPAHLIDLNTPVPSPGENINGMMATMNIK